MSLAEHVEAAPADQSNTSFNLDDVVAWPGPYLRLAPLNLTVLPSADGTSSTSGSIESHVHKILSEAHQLATRISSENNWNQTGSKTYKTVEAPIETWKSEVTADQVVSANQNNSSSPQLRDWKEYKENGAATEYWFARRSIHRDAAESGTASWAEFVAGLRDNHSENEKSYTPSIYDARLVLDFNQALSQSGIHDKINGLTMRIFEMCHTVPLRNRVFSTLVLTASLSPDEFLVAQFPVQLVGHPEGFYSNGKNKSLTDSEMKKTVTVGQYVSIERCVRRSDGQIEWLMATASDAKGGVPMFLQRPAIPGTICKDVEYFVKWTAERRAGK